MSSSSEHAGSSSPKDAESSSLENTVLPSPGNRPVAHTPPPEDWNEKICVFCKNFISSVALAKPCDHIFDHSCLERWLYSIKGCRTNECKRCHRVITSFQHSFRGNGSDPVEQIVDPPFLVSAGRDVRFERELGAAIGAGKIRISINHGILQPIDYDTVFRVMRDRYFDVNNFPPRMRLEIAARIRSEIRRHQSWGNNLPTIDAPAWVRERIARHEARQSQGCLRMVWDVIWRR